MGAAREYIGHCEVCGVVDHHLVHGVCPGCQGKMRWYADSGEDSGHTENLSAQAHAAGEDALPALLQEQAS